MFPQCFRNVSTTYCMAKHHLHLPAGFCTHLISHVKSVHPHSKSPTPTRIGCALWRSFPGDPCSSAPAGRACSRCGTWITSPPSERSKATTVPLMQSAPTPNRSSLPPGTCIRTNNRHVGALGKQDAGI